LEHGLRTAVLAARAAQAMSLPEDDQVTVFYAGAGGQQVRTRTEAPSRRLHPRRMGQARMPMEDPAGSG